MELDFDRNSAPNIFPDLHLSHVFFDVIGVYYLPQTNVERG